MGEARKHLKREPKSDEGFLEGTSPPVTATAFSLAIWGLEFGAAGRRLPAGSEYCVTEVAMTGSIEGIPEPGLLEGLTGGALGAASFGRKRELLDVGKASSFRMFCVF